ncbi:hypothetical protein GCM10012287_56580 [Streptomyces daqingensis]|uniref:Secreted protein n=1 Tax=Streptomyces daqingensis TaxID=1472640 RepID=A0ABQ2MTD4_9ACTN|nr:hypothetical protein [Streptomyces daqingensis]GGO58431.1 hypothetical protein GCM10012287_56580 [Streptomyces daqingensis]
MRKLREAALVAAVLGSVSMVGAGVATAQEETPVVVACTQSNGDDITQGDVDAPLLTALTPGGGDADSRAQQNNCGIDVEGNTNTSGDAAGGDTTGALVAVPEI